MSAPLRLVGFAAAVPAVAIVGFLAQSAAAAIVAGLVVRNGLGWTTG